ncbi:MAG: substrate-binding domain-containing protein [Ruminococcus sp.]|nr:substrate-binding domain-containing protein [Ruminococcus sp.]
MNHKKRPVIAVVTALANGFAEKEILGGIISENRKNGYPTVVFSNIYNIVQQNDELLCEQKIYDFVRSPDISGIILLCESFVEDHIRKRITSLLSRINAPIIGIGTRLDEFEPLDYTLLSTDDVADMEELTSHLIEAHGFRDIDILTGMQEIESSRLRVVGYLSALRAYGIAPDESRIHYGDFWFTSGEQLADRYISGELKLPQAVVCANDFMAYGMLRRFSDAGIRVPEQVTVVSYEYSDIRIYYSPALTSMRKNRRALGAAAAARLQAVLEGRTPPEFVPPRGELVFGGSCPCKGDEARSLSELRDAERRKNFIDLSLFSTMEHRLTLCRDMKEFISIISDHQWMIQDKRNIFLCLFSDWNEADPENSSIMHSVSMIDGTEAFEADCLDLRVFFERDRDSSVCYLNPLFSGKKLFGYMALLYGSASSYDDVYRHWLKSVSIGLEFLRLKNDIRYLISCQNVSEYRDTLTGMNNKKGLRRAFQAVRIHNNRRLYFVALRIDLFPRQLNDEEIRRKTEAVIGVSKAIAKFCGNHDISGRVAEDTFVCLVQSLVEPDVVADLLGAVLLQERAYIDYAGTSSFACCAIPCESESFDSLLAQSTERINEEQRRIAAFRKNRYYADMLAVRDRIYSETEITFDSDSENSFTDRIDFFRRNYKSCFGTAFHQDCINARIAKAKYYLATTSLAITDISEKCGYVDYKYFQRQFTANTGLPALRYRNLIKG